MFDIVFFSRVVSLLPIDGLIKSEAVVLVVSVSPLKFQDNPENFCREYVVESLRRCSQFLILYQDNNKESPLFIIQ